MEREAAETALAELKSSFHTAKRQKAVVDGVSSTDADVEEATQASVTDEEQTWKSWPLSRWRKHEGEMQQRRSRLVRAEGVCVDIANAYESLPPRGDETRGWRRHWRRGRPIPVLGWACLAR